MEIGGLEVGLEVRQVGVEAGSLVVVEKVQGVAGKAPVGLMAGQGVGVCTMEDLQQAHRWSERQTKEVYTCVTIGANPKFERSTLL